MVLSSGTLNLRFMQNARRAPPVEPVQPQDDAHWELAAHRAEKPSVRPPDVHSPPVSVAHESSYLPFLFPSLHDAPATDSHSFRPRGRRVFDKRGEEITPQASSSATVPAAPENTQHDAVEQTKTPHSISSTLGSKKSIKDPSKSARKLVFDMSGVGSDLRQSSTMQATAFLRPSGVDGPAVLAKPSDPARTAPQSSTGDASSPNPKPKRSRAAAEADKPKKKTRLTLIE